MTPARLSNFKCSRSVRVQLDPNLIVMKSRAAVRRDRIGASQRIYTAAVRIRVIGPDRLSDQHTAADPVIKPRMEADLAALIAEHHRVVVTDSCGHGVNGMN